MRRSEALKPLSHDHHQGLYVALQLKRAGPDTAAEAREAFLDFLGREAAHFRAEEELLLPAFARHEERELFPRIEDSLSAGELEELAAALKTAE